MDIQPPKQMNILLSNAGMAEKEDSPSFMRSRFGCKVRLPYSLHDVRAHYDDKVPALINAETGEEVFGDGDPVYDIETEKDIILMHQFYQKIELMILQGAPGEEIMTLIKTSDVPWHEGEKEKVEEYVRSISSFNKECLAYFAKREDERTKQMLSLNEEFMLEEEALKKSEIL